MFVFHATMITLASLLALSSAGDPETAEPAPKGQPVTVPEPLPGAILPGKRIVAYYGNPNSSRMGVLGEYRKDDMLARLKAEAGRWEEADPEHAVQRALHLIAVVCQAQPGNSGKYRLFMPDALMTRVLGWARESGAILFLDLQIGHDDLSAVLPRLEWILKEPDVHLGIDPEFHWPPSGKRAGIGTYDAADVNDAAGFLADLVREHELPPKVLVVHRFTWRMVTHAGQIKLRPEVQIVMDMDGWGSPALKRESYRAYVAREPVQFTGFKIFYHEDTKTGGRLMTPADVLRLAPQPMYIQYQ